MTRIVRIVPWPLAVARPPFTEAAMHCDEVDPLDGDSCITLAMIRALARCDE